MKWTINEYLLLGHIQTALSAIVAILSLVKFKSRDRIVRLIGLAFLTGSLANIGSLYFATIGLRDFINTPPVVYMIISFYLFTRVYYLAFKATNAKWFVLITCIFFSFAILNYFFIQKTFINSYSYTLYSAILTIYGLHYFYVLMRDRPLLHIYHLPMFWFNSALLLYHAEAFFIFLSIPYLVYVLKNDLLIHMSCHNALDIIQHFIILIGLYYDLKFLRAKKVEPSVATM